MKPLSESTLFHGMRRATEKRPSEMTKDELSVAVALMTKEERYRFDEGVAISCGSNQPTMTDYDFGYARVVELRNQIEP